MTSKVAGSKWFNDALWFGLRLRRPQIISRYVRRTTHTASVNLCSWIYLCVCECVTQYLHRFCCYDGSAGSRLSSDRLTFSADKTFYTFLFIAATAHSLHLLASITHVNMEFRCVSAWRVSLLIYWHMVALLISHKYKLFWAVLTFYDSWKMRRVRVNSKFSTSTLCTLALLRRHPASS